MKRRGALLLAVLVAVVPASTAYAGGAGGVAFGAQYFDSALSSSDMQMVSITGYGYGVDWDGSRVGGFGTTLFSGRGNAIGGAGGLIAGREWRAGPIIAGLTLWMGVGGLALDEAGYMIVYGQADVELGVAIFPWMQVVAYAGYQAFGNLVPGFPFSNAVLYSPVLGIRVGWGAP